MLSLLSKKAQANLSEDTSTYQLLQPDILNNPFLTPRDKEKLQTIQDSFNTYQVEKIKTLRVNSTTIIGEHLANLMHGELQEKVLVVSLKANNDVIAIDEVFKGSLNTSVAHPREIFKTAITHSAARIILAHNHPSGDTSPSEADLATTRRVVDAGELLGIECIDHFILGDTYLSLREQGLM